MARSVAISRTRLATALNIVFTAAKIAARPIMIAKTPAGAVDEGRHHLLLFRIELALASARRPARADLWSARP